MSGELCAGSAAAVLAMVLAGACASPPPPATAPRPEEPIVVPPRKVVHEPLSAEGISFESGSEVLRSTSAAALDDLAAAIGRSDEGARAMVRVTIQPDPRACSGEPLADQRAGAIKDALVARGVPARRVSAKGVGDKPPGCAAVSATRSTVVIELVD